MKQRDWTTLAEVVTERRDQRLQEQASGTPRFITTGIRKWDEHGGLKRRILTLIGLASGEGKSVIALHLARAAAKAGHGVLLVSLEDPAQDTADRVLAGESGIDSQDISLHRTKGREDKIDAAAARASKWAGMILFEEGKFDADELLAIVQSALDEGVGLVVIDYLQALIDRPGKTSKESELAYFTERMQTLAMKYDVAAVVMAQVDLQKVEAKGEARYEAARARQPDRHDVSGYRPGPGIAIISWCQRAAHNAKAVWFGFRPARWLKKHGQMAPETMELHAGKANFGKEGKIVLGFDPTTSTLSDRDS